MLSGNVETQGALAQDLMAPWFAGLELQGFISLFLQVYTWIQDTVKYFVEKGQTLALSSSWNMWSCVMKEFTWGISQHPGQLSPAMLSFLLSEVRETSRQRKW